MENNEHCTNLGLSARLDGLKSQERFWKNPEGSWKREDIGDWVIDTQNVRYYQNAWVRCRRKGDLRAALQWNAVQCTCWEPLGDGGVVSDTWTLSFQFSFEGFAADPGRNLLFLLDTRTIPGERTYRLTQSSWYFHDC